MPDNTTTKRMKTAEDPEKDSKTVPTRRMSVAEQEQLRRKPFRNPLSWFLGR